MASCSNSAQIFARENASQNAVWSSAPLPAATESAGNVGDGGGAVRREG